MVQQPPGPPPGGMQPPPPPPGQPPQAPAGPPKVQLDTSNLPIADIIVAGGALITMIFTFLAWYKVEVFGFGGGTGRGSYQNWPMIIYIFLLIFAGFFIINAMANLIDIDLPLGMIYMVWSIVGTFFILLAIVIRPGDWEFVKMNWIVWILALVFSLAPIAGAFIKMKES